MDSTEFQTSFDTEEYIFNEGDEGDCAYIIESGMVEISLEKDDRRLVMATLTKGEILGEMAIIDQLPRTASARAVIPTVVTPIPLDYVSQKIEQADPTLRIFLRLAMTRYRDLNRRLGQVFEELSLTHQDAWDEDYASTTMELENVVSQFTEMQKRIDAKVKEIVDEGYETAKRILTEKADDLERLAQGLLEYETLTGSEITRVMSGEALNRGDDDEDTPDQGGTASVTAIPKTKPKKKPSGDGGMEPEPTT